VTKIFNNTINDKIISHCQINAKLMQQIDCYCQTRKFNARNLKSNAKSVKLPKRKFYSQVEKWDLFRI